MLFSIILKAYIYCVLSFEESFSFTKLKKLKRLEWAGHLLRMSDDRTERKHFWGSQMEEEKQEDQN
jgi:hypothetical protein